MGGVMLDLQIHVEGGIASLTDPDNPQGMPALEGYGRTNREAVIALIDLIDMAEEGDREQAFHVNFSGNRFWVEQDTLLCAPINADGTIDWFNAGEVEAMDPAVQSRLVEMIKLLEDDSRRW
jgi:hypothetical protein